MRRSNLSWTAPASDGGSAITGYQVQVATSAGGLYSDATGCPTNSTATSCTVTGLSNGTQFFFRIAAINAVGTGAYSAASSGVTPGAFTDTPLVAGVTPIRAVHITELRTRIDALRARFGLAPFAWTDAPLTAGMTAATTHVTDLRTALQQAYTSAGDPSPTFTEPSLVPGNTVIKAVHLHELRDAVIVLEAR